jgi:hypothetical protein
LGKGKELLFQRRKLLLLYSKNNGLLQKEIISKLGEQWDVLNCLISRTIGCSELPTMEKEPQNVLVLAQPIELWNEIPGYVSVPHNVIY